MVNNGIAEEKYRVAQVWKKSSNQFLTKLGYALEVAEGKDAEAIKAAFPEQWNTKECMNH